MKFRKKPVVIEAVQNIPGNEKELLEFFDKTKVMFNAVKAHTFEIHTLEVVMTASPGDYLICGVQGEVYPCKPDIFLATYEEVLEDA